MNTSIGSCHSGCSPSPPGCSGHTCTTLFTPAANGQILEMFNIRNLEGAGERDYSELVLFTRDGEVVCEGNPNLQTSSVEPTVEPTPEPATPPCNYTKDNVSWGEYQISIPTGCTGSCDLEAGFLSGDNILFENFQYSPCKETCV